MRTIQQQWESYAAAVIPKDAPTVQIQECRRAFYAGAMAMNTVYLSTSTPDVSESAGVQIVEGVQQELKAFRDRIGIDC